MWDTNRKSVGKGENICDRNAFSTLKRKTTSFGQQKIESSEITVLDF